ncbi:peptide-methionine (R)-S-oxide reductase MsrB [Chromobacterium sp. IIBBL 290-4]|uniref:peptide-methionine (R)-S-oxide reductase MsrB n=1 Tax=Chromobacterium sp. IIBBL 290-4 TaxID=2953890 RepID=UPI0020B6F8B0|nr:peptide-methionine (R)-S-oxide reductase MsrB [Chromobacterium sp. IIBBL 290-4]UTH74427.1 peptide-methionine (R)-S-oxide reductase MsrB [Chromobacterium sp. IIBBL 290-4]
MAANRAIRPRPHKEPTVTIQKTDAEWRAQLTPEQYRVARQSGTERPFSGEHYFHNKQGDYHCACCGALLFHSDTKFDAGCGWPSFWAEAAGANIQRITDTSHGMVRVEVRCSNCDAHLGHVFEDGPDPSGERYCINSVCLDFKAK